MANEDETHAEKVAKQSALQGASGEHNTIETLLSPADGQLLGTSLIASLHYVRIRDLSDVSP